MQLQVHDKKISQMWIEDDSTILDLYGNNLTWRAVYLEIMGSVWQHCRLIHSRTFWGFVDTSTILYSYAETKMKYRIKYEKNLSYCSRCAMVYKH